MIKRVLILIFALGPSTIAVARPLGCSDMESGADSKISVRLTSDRKLPYDPTTTGFAQITFYNAVLGRLVSLNSNLTVQPMLLQDAYWDYKNQQYILRLRDNLKFHNGRTAIAEDLDFSLTRFFLSKKRVDQIAFLRQIKGVEKLTPGMTYSPWAVSGIKKIDARAIAIKLAAPNPAFLYSLSEGWISLVPKEELLPDLVTWKSVPVGAGPYKVEIVGIENVRVCRTDKNGTAPSRIDFVSDTKANADVVGFVPPATAAPLKKVYGSGPIGFTGIFFNSNSALGGNPHFRRALSLAVNRKDIIAQNSDFSPLTEILTSNFYGRLGVSESADLNAAKAELSQVPAQLLKRKIKANWFSGRSIPTPSDRNIIQVVTKQFKQLGLDVEFGPSDNPTFSETDTETVLRVDDRGTAFVDPLVIFRAFEKPAFLSPFFPKDNIALKSLLTNAAKSQSLDVKANAIFALSKYFYENSIVIPLYERKTVYWVNPEKVADLGVQTGITFDFERLQMARKSKL